MLGVKAIRHRHTSWRNAVREFLPDLLITAWNLCSILLDWIILRTALRVGRRRFAFLVHASAIHNIYTPLPLLRYLPEGWVLYLAKLLPPYRIGALEVKKENLRVKGDLLTITITPDHLGNPRERYHVSRKEAVHLVEREVKLAALRGAKLAGLGAYLPSLTKQGQLLQKDGVGLTTGHTCATLLIGEYVEEIAQRVDVDLDRETVAIVGAAGSTGTAVARFLKVREQVKHLLLFDLPQQEAPLKALAHECGARASTNLLDLREASIIITLTTTPGSIITPKMLGPSVVILDDSRPRNTDEQVLRPAIERGQALVVDVLAEIPGLSTSFHYDLDMGRQEVTYTCLAEVIALTLAGWENDYTVGKVDPGKLEHMEELLRKAGIRRAPLTSFNRPLSQEQILRMREKRRILLAS